MYYASIGFLALIIHCIINLEYLLPGRALHVSSVMLRYKYFLYSVALFYIADLLWGSLTDSGIVPLAYIDTLLFFMSMVWSVLMWTRFVVAYLGRNDRFSFILSCGGWILFAFEILALVINLFTPVVFKYSEDGAYLTGLGRTITLFAQVVLYLISSIFSLAIARKAEGRTKMHHATIGISGLVMASFIALQAINPFLPFYSIGCLVATCIVHTFVVQDEKLEHKKAVTNAKQIAYRDPLTGVKSARAYQEAKAVFDRRISELQLKELGVIVFDVNGLKQVNDNLGHEEGDKYIQAGSELICNQFQHSPVYRIGGDEFVVILEGEDYRARLELLSAFDRQMEENQKAGIVTVSSGLDTFRPGRDIDFNSIFERADQRMYERKKYLKSLVANNG